MEPLLPGRTGFKHEFLDDPRYMRKPIGELVDVVYGTQKGASAMRNPCTLLPKWHSTHIIQPEQGCFSEVLWEGMRIAKIPPRGALLGALAGGGFRLRRGHGYNRHAEYLACRMSLGIHRSVHWRPYLSSD